MIQLKIAIKTSIILFLQPMISPLAMGRNQEALKSSRSFSGPQNEAPARFAGHLLDEETGLVYMKARFYDSNHGSFISADPLLTSRPEYCLDKYRECGLYSYVTENPIANRDPEGKLTVVIHGTFAKKNSWTSDIADQVGSQLDNRNEALKAIRPERVVTPVWSGGNNDRARRQAANSISEIISQHNFVPGERLTIVGHSHGGNVAKIISEQMDRKIDLLVTLGTPNRADYRANMDRIGTYINAYAADDRIIPLGQNIFRFPRPTKKSDQAHDNFSFGKLSRKWYQISDAHSKSHSGDNVNRILNRIKAVKKLQSWAKRRRANRSN